tara:strand:- start:11853 stop:12284 length:432 start_codon:yes stop_codon:yes gene_type:complete
MEEHKFYIIKFFLLSSILLASCEEKYESLESELTSIIENTEWRYPNFARQDMYDTYIFLPEKKFKEVLKNSERDPGITDYGTWQIEGDYILINGNEKWLINNELNKIEEVDEYSKYKTTFNLYKGFKKNISTLDEIKSKYKTN